MESSTITRSCAPGSKQFLGEQVDLRVTGEAADGAGALQLARGGELDVLVMDLAMPDQSGVDALAAIKARFPELPVLILSGYPETHYATTLLKQGASGYLNKECDPMEIAEAHPHGRARPALHHAGGGRVAGRPGDRRRRHGRRTKRLSERELQVFLQLAQGQTVGQLADAMCLSVKTVSTYRTRVLEKLKLKTNSDLTYYALKNGLIQ